MKRSFAFVVIALFAGCGTSRSSEPLIEVNNVAVVMTSHNSSLRDAIIRAAVRRRWNPQVQDDGTIRCQLVQRSNVVTICIVLNSETTYSIVPVDSNIPTRKYNQWIRNLQREIAKQAVM